LTEKERELCEAQWIVEFENGIKIEKSYGCTLMTAVFTPDYWFAFHIGDGKMISLQGNPIFMEPVPWDDRCFLNKTTSLCDTEPLDEFRYCYCGDGSFPDAVFLGSDGIDDTFGDGENLAEFYIKIAKGIVENGEEKTSEEVKKLLPDLSKRGSQDDMSLAVVYDADKISAHISSYKSFILKTIETEISEKKKRVEKFEGEIKTKKTDYNKALSTKENAQNKLSSTKAEYEATVKECKEKEEIAKKIVDFITGAKRKVTALEQSVKDAESKLSKAEKELSYSERAYQIAQKEFEEAQKELEVLLKKKDEIVH
ncbi:MAG: protein phosphatase 2C domain-containing protein, partial [Bacteroidales bacterium]|nr:protein phosphatase 2C domain-containing protein [Bacteroidales bacterium]